MQVWNNVAGKPNVRRPEKDIKINDLETGPGWYQIALVQQAIKQ